MKIAGAYYIQRHICRSEGFPNGIFHPCALWDGGLARWKNCRAAGRRHLEIRVLRFGFGFWDWVLGLGFGIGFWVLGVGVGFWDWVLGFGFRDWVMGLGFGFWDWVIWDIGLGLGFMGYRFGIGVCDPGFGIGFLGYRFWVWVNISRFPN